ncbi:MAG: phosphonopyruvate decarboxylase [Rhodospirillales bacterium]|nr:phosphonopyruvate decarboxylase [Rhodospirillales bacterium]
MIRAESFLTESLAAGFDFYSGVPCSFLTPIINRTIGDNRLTYVGAASEGEAVAIAAGAWLAGRGTAVMFQNSGLGNAVNPLTSLNYPFRIPTLLICTWRGGPGIKDEPQHELMGQITAALFDTMRIPRRPFPRSESAIAGALEEAKAKMTASLLPFAFIMEKGDVAEEKLTASPPAPKSPGTRHDRRARGQYPTRYAALERLLAEIPGAAAVIATTGKCGRELFALADRPQHLYQVGSMGCASGMGLGLALNTARPVAVLDGDGAALMKMGTMATIGAYSPRNLVHVVLDNASHDSTGGQPTVSPVVDFAAIALACGYAHAHAADDPGGFAAALRDSFSAPGPHLIHLRVAPGSLDKLGRPTVTPPEVARRFKAFLAGDGGGGGVP